MNLYCIEDFKIEFEKLKSKKSYSTIEQEIVEYFFGKSSEEISSGVRLNHSIDAPYIKKRLGGSGGFRIYFLLLIKGESIYLMFIHPKTGPMGTDNITDESKAYLYKKVLESIKSNDLYKMTLNKEGMKVTFEKK